MIALLGTLSECANKIATNRRLQPTARSVGVSVGTDPVASKAMAG
jgi:hypothetical protein